MKSPLHVLYLEDDPNDAALVLSTLKTEGIVCEAKRVETREDFIAAIEHGGFDIIFSDFALPTFDGIAALEITQKQCPDVPFILVSGTLGEDLAIESLKSGATDYVLKQRLSRLTPAVRRAMRDVEAITDRKQLEAQFIEAQKMEVLGQLAGGIAHDFNNLLAVIMGNSELLMVKLPPNDPLRKEVEEIGHAADRAAGLTRQLLAFSRKQTVQPIVLDLNEVVAGMDKMLRRLIDENVELRIMAGKDLGRIKADSGHVGQVLMNLAVNARDAMAKGGHLSIETSNATLDEDYGRTHPGVTPGNYVMLAVRDTGSGMAEEVKAHLFEPFFTTKPKGKGTGLGLATCQTIVKQCGGHIDVYSKLGKGTIFKIYFPRVELDLKTPTFPLAKGTAMPRGTETILFVEDEPAVRQLACGILVTLGYNVLRATNGQEGLDLARKQEGEPIRLVVTDVIMPQMGGKVMADWLKATYPDLKVLFTSGYTDDALAEHGILEPGIQFLPKPYTLAALAGKVREVLDSESAPHPAVTNDVTPAAHVFAIP
jgi:two-component system cell cycle sensor histidine kinase/response regulator CckA